MLRPSRQSAAAERELAAEGFLKHIALLCGSPEFFVTAMSAPKLDVNRFAVALDTQIAYARVVAAIEGIGHAQDCSELPDRFAIL